MKRRAFIAASASASALTCASIVRAQAAPIRVAGIPIDVGANCYYAGDGGIFKKHGLDIEIITGGSGATIAAAVIGGSLDIGDGNTTVLAQAHERGVPLVMMAPSGMYRSTEPTGALLVAKNSPAKTAHDLAGKTIGVNAVRALGEVSVRAWLDKNGVPSADAKYVEVPYSAMDPGLNAGRIDAAMAEEPAVSAMLAANSRVFARPYDAIATQFVEGGFFCTLDYAKAHPDVIKRFGDAIAEANMWANQHRDESLAILNKYAKTSFSRDMARMWYPERLRAADLQPLIDVSVKYGLLQKTFSARELFAPGIQG